jgi:uncharacterized surface protein with fasciclin (FAS1) repeats
VATEEPTEEPTEEMATEEVMTEEPTEEPTEEMATEEAMTEEPTEEMATEEATEEPTATDRPTRTPRPTATEEPTDEPTATSRPTRTSRPTATTEPTDEPTSTSRPTRTPRPTATVQLGTIIQVAGEAGDFTILLAALEATDLAADLGADGSYTVFAPTDTAFEEALTALGLTQDELLADTDLLTSILRYHIVDGAVLAADMDDGDTLTTLLEDQSIAVSVAGNEVMLNDSINVATSDILASNGVIHVIDGVLLPPAAETAAPTPTATRTPRS